LKKKIYQYCFFKDRVRVLMDFSFATKNVEKLVEIIVLSCSNPYCPTSLENWVKQIKLLVQKGTGNQNCHQKSKKSLKHLLICLA